ncbi:putative cysteine ligase BshC [Staphylococcus auricularis]|uniref:Putative cysteine ligase BshC n=1 Tax=Staphylococcus auricularis TaxID=29379 RepID=A0AAP8TTX0_9STAP|nr:bacillithiol biosynthesis cysteine-adding enzyme BshC [Staphylococcus auricularis]PNZ69005.1 bacillithiol biosynthesis cysteine-adding enzyme BshC [Staphylococcus auricularis]QPT05541.1 bacillithiol biosynthesis cysteine-adding enzyme BshC [Staphylococcus auricularis]BCU52069.1 putative cysteine ligase BshC [Staphylococcus auricularis]SQJ10274.1 bacillithiol biosynthesis cysteine-adding enzyme BshC [Staphylococcus auricularis]
MDCKTVKLDEKDQFINRIKQSDATLMNFYQFDAMSQAHYEQKINSPNNGRESALAHVIEDYMSDLDLTDKQHQSLKQLSEGAKVVIGGQQAGLLGGPLYTFHKILSIIQLSQSLSQQFETDVVPVFWIAGEDHDFDEVNHTYTYNGKDAALHKVKYHTLEPPESNVSRFIPDKGELRAALHDMFKQLDETKHTRAILNMYQRIIDTYDSWTDIFKALIHEVFKDYGLLVIDAHDRQLRELEVPMLKTMIESHEQIDQVFRANQKETMDSGLTQMIQTDTNVHLFLHEEDRRQLLHFEDGHFTMAKSDETYTIQELLELVEADPQRFSNNVVTRPIMEEWLFNTVAFVGGPSEIKYWAELRRVFETLEVPMPIVLPRMRITYQYPRTNKLLNMYDLDEKEVINQGIASYKQHFVRAQASDTFIQSVEQLKDEQAKVYETLSQEVANNNDNQVLLEKNNQIHQAQYDYLLNRYLLNIERENDVSMKHFNELDHTLHPMGGLQERIWNPMQVMNDFGKNMFNPSTFPPLSYTFDQIIIEP